MSLILSREKRFSKPGIMNWLLRSPDIRLLVLIISAMDLLSLG